LGVRQRTLLRTLTASARIKVGNCAGLSGAVVCAANSVEIGDNCLLGANVTIVDTDFHNLEPRNRRFADPDWARISSPVRIGENVFVGANAMILKGVEIGANTVVGAASVVTRSLPANVIAAGNPARVIGNLPPPDVP
jgi:acetyltransferase-like isoleucine patch superfamily enzyme